MLRIHCGAGEAEFREVVSPSGSMTAVVDLGGKSPSYTVQALETTDRSAAFSVKNGTPQIRLTTESGNLVLTTRGYSLRRGGRGAPKVIAYSPAEFRKLGALVQADKELHQSVFKLRKSMRQTIYGFAASEGLAPAQQFVKKMLESSKKQTAFAAKPRNLNCNVDRVVTTVTREVEGWITSVVAAAEQALACEEKCRSKPDTNVVEYGACLARCASSLFTDLVTQTWGVVDTITEEVVTEVTHCSRVPGLFPASTGPFEVPGDFIIQPAAPVAPPSGALVTKALGPFADAFACLLHGQWKFSNLGDIKVAIPGVRDVPIGVTVCIDRACTDKLKAATTGVALGEVVLAAAATLLAPGAVEAWLTSIGLTATVTALAAAAGLTATQMTQLLLFLLLVLAAHALVVGGQIVVWDLLNQAPNGVCLTYPAVPVLTAVSIFSVFALNAVVQTPVIVTPR